MINDRKIAATWSDTGKVHIWDLSRLVHAMNDSSVMAAYTRNQESPNALFTFNGHMTEGKRNFSSLTLKLMIFLIFVGFAMDWSPTVPGTSYRKLYRA